MTSPTYVSPSKAGSPPPSRPVSAARALLFVPGNRAERFDKAVGSGADAAILDLEDAVGGADKPAARAAVIGYLANLGANEARTGRDVPVGVRVNNLYTAAGAADLAALVEGHAMGARPDFVLLPKVESAFETELYARQLPGVAVLALIESGRGLEQAAAIAASHPAMAALTVGGLDLCADLGAAFSWEPLLYGRSRVVQAAAAAGIAALDMPFFDLKDDSALEGECQRVKALGYSGKLAIHPKHVATMQAVFSPTPDEVEFAHGVIAAAQSARGNVFEYRGRMIDDPVIRAARRTLARVGSKG
jgi:(S)-citramalyl-CoA lyase